MKAFFVVVIETADNTRFLADDISRKLEVLTQSVAEVWTTGPVPSVRVSQVQPDPEDPGRVVFPISQAGPMTAGAAISRPGACAPGLRSRTSGGLGKLASDHWQS